MRPRVAPDTVESNTAGADTVASRRASWRAKRHRKAQTLDQTVQRGWVQQARSALRRTGSIIRPNQVLLDLPSSSAAGLRPAFGGLRGNAAFPVGLHYQPDWLNRGDHHAFAQALTSLNQYWGTDVIYGRDMGTWMAYAYGRYRHQPSQEFYGVGATSRRDRVSVFRLNEAVVGGLLARMLGERTLLGGHASYRADRYGRGTITGEAPRLETRFAGAWPAGTGQDIDYAMLSTFFEYDGRSTPYTRSFARRFAPTAHDLRSISLDAEWGTYVAAQLTHYADMAKQQYGFTRLAFDVQQYVPLEKEALHGIALRQFTSLTRTPPGQQVPFYHLQALGGARSLRGYSVTRFQDRNVVLLNAEFRCHVWHWLDMALFTDAGRVFHRIDALGLSRIRYNVGVGFRVRVNDQTLGRFEVARSPEGITTHLRLGSLL